MRSHALLLGQTIHQLLIFLPLGLLAAAVVFDLVDLATGTGAFAVAAYWILAGGVVAGLMAAPFRLVEWLRTTVGTPARSTGALYGSVNAVVVLLFACSWVLRDSQGGVPMAALALSLTAALVAVVTALFASELVCGSANVADDAGTEGLSSLNFDERPSRSSPRAH